MSYYIAPSFLDKLAVHITKNYLDIPGVRVPLILGIHGRKGEGKSFQCELVFEKMGVEVTHISGGELESPDAGDPARLIRLRYRETAELIKVRGKMCVLMINDLDAGAGRFDEGTQYTVNTQLVNATLMNIADNPTDVQLPGSYDSNPLHRVPIIVTGNDFSTLYAPLIRDGRMEKFYWEPSREDKVGIVGGIFSEDGLSHQDIEDLVNQFSHQAIDFFGALRSRIYDQQISGFIHEVGVERISKRVVNSNEAAPSFRKPDFSLSNLMDIAQLMVEEQRHVDDSHLVEEYNRGALRSEGYLTPIYQARPTHQLEPSPIENSTIKAKTPNSLPTYQAKVKHHIDPQAVQIPKLGDGGSNQQSSTYNSHPNNTQIPTTHVGPVILGQMQQILAFGNHIAVEYADKGQFERGSWETYANHEIDRMADAIATLEGCLFEHNQAYVRIVGINPSTKQKSGEAIIQIPDGNPYESSLGGSSFKYPEVSTPFPNPHRNYQLNPSQSKDDSTASNSSLGGSSFKYPEPSTPYSNPYSNYQLGAKLSESKNDSVQEETSKYIPTSGIQTPSSSSLGGSSFKYPEPSTPYSNPYSNYLLGRKLSESENDPTPQSSNKYNSQIPTAHLELEILEQMREILAVGNHIAIEYVDKRRFRTGSWKSFSQHQIDDMADAIATLEECLAQHNHDYIRLIAVDPSAKRRVFETIIQRPDAKSFSN